MKILCCCSQGNNRSVNLATRLKYSGHETLSVGLDKNSHETLDMLFKWADKIICTEDIQVIPDEYMDKYMACDVGKDVYPRPFNRDLDYIMTQWIETNKEHFNK